MDLRSNTSKMTAARLVELTKLSNCHPRSVLIEDPVFQAMDLGDNMHRIIAPALSNKVLPVPSALSIN